MKRPTVLLSILLGLFLLRVEGLRGIALQPDSDNVASRHLAGEWRLQADLSQRLTGGRTGAPDLVSIIPDPSVLNSLPPRIEEMLKSSPVYLAGTLTFAKTRFTFLLTEQGGAQRLVCFQHESADSGALSILFDVIPAKEPQNDLLFLGGERDGQPFFAYERDASSKVSPLSKETRGLLLDALSDSYSSSLEKLSERPDWQSVVDLLLEEIRGDPKGQHNNRCIVLRALVARHLAEARLDIQPLLVVLASRSWTNQQKASDVLAEAVHRPDLFKGREEETIRAMIPLTASQRGPVVEPALQVLQTLTGEKALQREPLAWAKWFEARFGGKIELGGSVYELVDVIATKRSPDGNPSFWAEGKLLRSTDELRAQLQNFISRARAAGLDPRFVALVSTPVISSETRSKALRDAQPIRDVLGALGIEEITLTPGGTVFYPPFEPGFPSRPGKPDSQPHS